MHTIHRNRGFVDADYVIYADAPHVDMVTCVVSSLNDNFRCITHGSIDAACLCCCHDMEPCPTLCEWLIADCHQFHLDYWGCTT